MATDAATAATTFGPPPPDAAHREAALDPRASFIVQAPAGSGKTTLLTQRYLALLACAERPEEILAITFTRKAAAEMRHRILESLARAARDEAARNASDARSLELARAALGRSAREGWDLLEHPSRLRVQTIDALNQWLAHRLPVLSRAGAAPTVHDRPEELCELAAARVVAMLEGEDPVAERLATVLVHLDNDVAALERLLADMLARRDHWLKLVGRGFGHADVAAVRAALEGSLASLVAEPLRGARERLERAGARELVRLCGAAADRRVADDPRWACVRGLTSLPPASSAALPEWQCLVDLLLTGEGTWRAKVDKRHGFPTTAKADKEAFLRLLEDLAAVPGLCETLAAIRELPPATYSDAQWEVLAALVDVLVVAAAELQLVFAERGAVDFVAVARAALDALGTSDEPTEFALALDYQVRHLLVDEFQDTSVAQVQLLERLTAGWQPGDGRTLFCVGDPMQSIYRFREADVALFLKIRGRGLGDVALRSLVLEANFRSRAPIVEWVNAAFARVLPAEDDLARGAVRYARSHPMRGAADGAGVECHALPRADATLEARRVAQLVASERAANPEATIAVLARSRAHLVGVAHELRRADVRYQGLDLVPLADRLPIRDLVSLTRALAHLGDRAAWLACLRAPWCGLDLLSLHALVGDDRRGIVREQLADPVRRARLPVPLRARVERALGVLDATLADRGRRPLAACVEAAWIELGGPATLLEASDLEDVRTYLERLDRAERAGDLDDPARLEELLAELYAAPDALADGRLQLLTIHRAKGLEWDVVIVPGLGRAARGDASQLLRWFEFERADEPPGLVLAPVKARSAKSDPLESWLRALDADRAELELGRLLYVAATRARHRLHLVAHLEPTGGEGEAAAFRTPRRGTALAVLWDAIGSQLQAQLAGAGVAERGGGDEPASASASGGSDAAAGPERGGGGTPPGVAADAVASEPSASQRVRLQRLADDWRAPPAEDRVRAGSDLTTGLTPERVEFEWVTAAGRHAGTVVHEELERLGRVGLPDAPHALDERLPHWRRRLRELGLPEDRLADTLERVRAALARTLADPRGRWLFDASHREVATEYALTALVDSRVVVATMDRTFVAADGTRWIVDFKTSRHEGAELERFLDTERARYAAQLERYAAVMRLKEPARPIRLGLYFPLHGGWREWAPGEPAPEGLRTSP